jgi:carboxylesterase
MNGNHAQRRGCLLLHGFTGGPYEVMPLADYLRARGWECSVPTLPGHEGPLRELNRVQRQEWVKSAAQAAEEMAQRYGTFDLVGFSMGGLIAAYLANRYPVRRLALLSTAVYYISPGRFVRNATELIRTGQMRNLQVKYGTPLKAVLEFTRLAAELKQEFEQIRVPTFIAHGDRDEIVHPRSALYIAHRVKAEKEVAIFPESRHLICLDGEAEQLFRQVERFFLEP